MMKPVGSRARAHNSHISHTSPHLSLLIYQDGKIFSSLMTEKLIKFETKLCQNVQSFDQIKIHNIKTD